MMTAFGSGMECATLMYSMSNGPRLKRWPAVITLTGISSDPGSLARLA